MSSQTFSDIDIFGQVQMGYTVVQSNNISKWQEFLQRGIGLHLESATSDSLAFRMDNHTKRLIIERGEAEDVVAIGYQLRDQNTLDTVLARLAYYNIAIEYGDELEAAQRGVTSLVRFRGPKHLTIELFIDAATTTEPLSMLCKDGFVTGESGMGHVAITSRLPEKMLAFWQSIFDARLSDRISQKMAGVTLDINFLRLNERHHSIAIAAVRDLRLDPIRTNVQHLNLLVNSLDDLVGAFQRLRQLGYEMAHEIGQHPNDRELSFYVLSPSGFEVELGWNALTVDENTWQQAHYNAISLWGHQPENTSALAKAILNLGNFQRGLRSLKNTEYSPL